MSSVAQIDTIAKSLHKADEWMRDLKEELEIEDTAKAFKDFRAVLHVLRDRLPVNEAVKLGGQLPLVLSGIYFENWHPADKPEKFRNREDLLRLISEQLPEESNETSGRIFHAVFNLLELHIPKGMIDNVKDNLPKDIYEFVESK